jgi:hypothetical protein
MTPLHEPFDDTTKIFYRQFFENKGIAVETVGDEKNENENT